MAFYAGSHPRTGNPAEPLKHTVQGGAFQGSGRQLTPRRDATPRHATGSQPLSCPATEP
jgi:hypothetical protein